MNTSPVFPQNLFLMSFHTYPMCSAGDTPFPSCMIFLLNIAPLSLSTCQFITYIFQLSWLPFWAYQDRCCRCLQEKASPEYVCNAAPEFWVIFCALIVKLPTEPEQELSYSTCVTVFFLNSPTIKVTEGSCCSLHEGSWTYLQQRNFSHPTYFEPAGRACLSSLVMLRNKGRGASRPSPAILHLFCKAENFL